MGDLLGVLPGNGVKEQQLQYLVVCKALQSRVQKALPHPVPVTEGGLFSLLIGRYARQIGFRFHFLVSLGNGTVKLIIGNMADIGVGQHSSTSVHMCVLYRKYL